MGKTARNLHEVQYLKIIQYKYEGKKETRRQKRTAAIFIISQHSAQLAEPATPSKKKERTLNLVVLPAQAVVCAHGPRLTSVHSSGQAAV